MFIFVVKMIKKRIKSTFEIRYIIYPLLLKFKYCFYDF